TEFVDFVDGTWIFRVEHFSRYGLDDDDLYDEDEDLEQPPAVQAQGPMQGFEQATAAPALQTQGPVDGPRAVADPPSSQPRRYVPPPPQQLLAGGRRAASLRRAPVKRASLFSAPPPPAEPVGCKRRADAIEPARPAAPVARPAAARELDLPPPSKYLRASESRLARELLAAPQPYARSLTHGRSGLSADAGLMMARSFRVAFGAQGQLVYLRGGAASSVVAIDSVARHVNASPDAAVYANAARAQWEHSAVTRGADGLPRVCVRDDASVAAVLRAAAAAGQDDDSEERRVLELAAVLFDRDVTDHVQAVRQRQDLTRWLMDAVHASVQRDLMRASQSPAPSADSVFALLTGHRVEAACLAATSHRDYRLATLVAQGGAGAVGGGGNDAQMQALLRAQLDLPGLSPAYRRVYELLAGRDVAAGLDWKRAFGVGLWFAQSPADPVAAAVDAYVDAFETRARVAPPLPAWLFGGGNDDSALSLHELRAAGGVHERQLDLCRRGVWDPAFQLLRLHSQPAYALERALLSESFTPARGDVRQPAMLAWLLLRVRRCRGFDDALSYDRLLAAWAFQLEAAGLWHWACFVLLQLSSAPHRDYAIRALLERALPVSRPTPTLPPAIGADLLPLVAETAADDADETEERIRFVLQELLLPRAWLYGALATRSRYDRDHAGGGAVSVPAPRPITAFSPRSASLGAPLSGVDVAAQATLRQFAWLLSAGQAAAAHALVVQRIAPDAILRGEYQLLRRALEHLQRVDCGLVPADEWAAGGQVYLSFIAAVEELPAVLQAIADSSSVDADVEAQAQRVRDICEQMQSLLAALPSLLSRFESSQPVIGIYDAGGEANWYVGEEAHELHVKYTVATSEMASVVTGFLQELAVSGEVDSTSLPLAQDMRILRTYQLAKSCFGSLVSSELEA
ncbi:hypothetical protein IWW55_001763, partial [Coemansia sp. RSA 2706]